MSTKASLEEICIKCVSGGHPKSDRKKYGDLHHYKGKATESVLDKAVRLDKSYFSYYLQLDEHGQLQVVPVKTAAVEAVDKTMKTIKQLTHNFAIEQLKEIPRLIAENNISGIVNPISLMDEISIQDLKLILDEQVAKLGGK